MMFIRFLDIDTSRWVGSNEEWTCELAQVTKKEFFENTMPHEGMFLEYFYATWM
jgi:hypothetical protein